MRDRVLFSPFIRRLSVPLLPCSHVSNTLLCPTVGYLAEYIHFQPNALQPNYRASLLKNISSSYVSVSYVPRLHDFRNLQISDDARETAGFGKYFQPKLFLDSDEKQSLNKDVQPDIYHHSLECPNDRPERRRRGKRKHGNKGKIPWNKGRKHTAETRALIKQRTIKALRDPQVRKKMSEHPRAHSEAERAKIGLALRQVWAKRLKWKRLKEKFFISWAKSIAKAAKKGGSDQRELDWDSYDKIKQEMTLKQVHCASEKAKSKDFTKMAAERVAQIKAEKMAMLAQRRKEREEKAKAKRKLHRKSKKIAKKISVARELTLQQRLTKIRKKKSINGQVVNGGSDLISHSSAWEKLDIELVKREKLKRREMSLADQIQAAKNKRKEPMARKALAAPSRVHMFTGAPE